MAVYGQVSACEQSPEPFEANWALMYSMSDKPKKPATGEADQWTFGSGIDAWLVSILLQNSIGNESVTCQMCNLEQIL